MKNKYVISSLTALSAMSTASCNYGMKTNVQYFDLGIGGHVMNFLESGSDSLFGVNGSMQGFIAKSNGICGMIDAYASWSKTSTFHPVFATGATNGWSTSAELKGYVFDGDIAIGKDFCFSDDKTIRHHRVKEHDLYSRIVVGIDIGGRKIHFKNKDSATADVTAKLTKADTHSFFVGAKCKMMYPMDNALVIFDIKAGPVVYGKGEYEGIKTVTVSVPGSGSNPSTSTTTTTKEKMETDQNIGAKVKAFISVIYRMNDNDFGMGMKVSVDYNYRTEEVRKNPRNILSPLVGEELEGAFSNNMIGTIELVFVYSTV